MEGGNGDERRCRLDPGAGDNVGHERHEEQQRQSPEHEAEDAVENPGNDAEEPPDSGGLGIVLRVHEIFDALHDWLLHEQNPGTFRVAGVLYHVNCGMWLVGGEGVVPQVIEPLTPPLLTDLLIGGHRAPQVLVPPDPDTMELDVGQHVLILAIPSPVIGAHDPFLALREIGPGGRIPDGDLLWDAVALQVVQEYIGKRLVHEVRHVVGLRVPEGDESKFSVHIYPSCYLNLGPHVLHSADSLSPSPVTASRADRRIGRVVLFASLMHSQQAADSSSSTAI